MPVPTVDAMILRSVSVCATRSTNVTVVSCLTLRYHAEVQSTMCEDHKVGEYIILFAVILAIFAAINYIAHSIYGVFTKSQMVKEEEARKHNKRVAEVQRINKEKANKAELDGLIRQITQTRRKI